MKAGDVHTFTVPDLVIPTGSPRPYLSNIDARRVEDLSADGLADLASLWGNMPNLGPVIDAQALLDLRWAADDAGYIGLEEWRTEWLDGEASDVRAATLAKAMADTKRRNKRRAKAG